MRWSNLTIDEDEATRLPGHRDPATIRRFDAPEALDIRFYEIHAKSAINRVPPASQMPFRWTINPYRGCTHACTYCLAGETPILMADGRVRSMRDLRAGDRVYGTERRGARRRYVTTTVLDHWSTVKPAYRITLHDGTELIASGDHRFLTARGWKHVTGAEQGRHRRPHLTTVDALAGTGGFAPRSAQTADYRRGYLCALIRGDGHAGSYGSERPGRGFGEVHPSRPALVDLEAVERARAFLADAGVQTAQFAFAAATAQRRTAHAIGASSPDGVESVRELAAWPIAPSDEWQRGFLAGICDAEGSSEDAVIGISDGDPLIRGWTMACLRHFGFSAVEEPPNADGRRNIRIRGGLRERLRLFHLADPAIGRRLVIEGTAVKSDAGTRIASIEPLGRAQQLYDITTATGDFIANGVVSHNCFARPTHKYLDFDAGRDFEREIVVKVNAPEVVRAELRRPSWKGEHVAMGTNTDPYQWVESRYRLMPGIWEAMRDARNPCSILTKSPLLLRDIELMKQIAAVTQIHANLSIPTLDPKAWRATEPHTPHPRARLKAVAELNRAGIPTGVLIAPLMPGINDAPEQLGPLLEACAEAGAVSIGGIALHLRGDVKKLFFDWLRAERPDLVKRYEQLYTGGAYAPKDERRRLAELVRREATSSWPGRFRGLGPPEIETETEPNKPSEPRVEQVTLF